jgi:hypothetical protein
MKEGRRDAVQLLLTLCRRARGKSRRRSRPDFGFAYDDTISAKSRYAVNMDEAFPDDGRAGARF